MNQFGVGVLIAKPAVTTANPNPTARKFGTLQSVSSDESYDSKPLHGSYSAALRNGRGKLKITLKAKFAKISGKQYADIFNMGTVTTGAQLIALNEVAVILAAAPPIIVTRGATFLEDLGVEYVSGLPLVCVPAAPTVGQYSVNSATGSYTFAVADVGATVLFTYKYSVLTGFTVTKNNQLAQESPYFEVSLMQQSADGQRVKVYPRCSATKLAEEYKQDDWTIPDLEISAFDNGSGVYGVEYYANE